MTCRDEVLGVIRTLVAGRPDQDFLLREVVDSMRAKHTKYSSSTIVTHICSRMCVNAPAHHGSRYADVERIGEGRYRLL